MKRQSILFFVGILALTMTACTGGDEASTEDGGETAGGEAGLSGEIAADGSSTVLPISEIMAEDFQGDNADVNVVVASSGTGGGFEKFCSGDTDISNASRPIKEEEIAACEENGVEFVEIPVAFDGLTVVVNPENDWAECLTTEELNKMWATPAEDTVTNWNQVNGEFPDEELKLYGPGEDSGTFDYFNEAVTDEEGSRKDYSNVGEKDNVIVQGVSAGKGALGYFGYAYFEENQDSLKAVEIENAEGECVAPSAEAIADGTYNPLARPLFIYLKKESLESKPEVKAFAEYHLANPTLVEEVGYVALPDDILEKAKARLDSATTGAMFEGGSSLGQKLIDKL
ncbi:MAG: PstS family phosphate ABC transporter substrate-binding protein [Spirulinaceae cyanobacterium]